VTDPIDLTVVIPCRNGAATLGAQLQALLEQEAIGAWEIVVADNGSTDATADVIASFADAAVPVRRVDAGETAGINYGRNRGVQAGRGALVVLCDADDVVEQGWLRELWTTFESGADLVGGALRHFSAACGVLDATPELPSWPMHGFLPRPSGANCGFTREAYDAIGGFDERFQGGADETEFFWRAQLSGYRLRFVENAVVRYSHRESLRGLFKQKFRYGRAQAQLYAQFRGAGMPRSSTRGAVKEWSRFPLYAVRIGLSSKRRDAAIRILGFAIGRAAGSWRYRVWYP
jgi:glycosyltransferase involved in cell wall biosynthesis